MKSGYDAVAERYAAQRTMDRRDAKYLGLLVERLPPGSRVLDLGCGAGVPITKALAERYRVIGVDFSGKMIALAKNLVPNATFRKADMTTVLFPPRSFDAVTSFVAVIHVPREGHRGLFRRIHGWLKPRGLLLVILGADEWVSSEDDRFLGVPMYWSQFDVPTSKGILEDCGFRILASSVERETFDGEPEKHLYVLATKANTRRAAVGGADAAGRGRDPATSQGRGPRGLH